MRARRFRVTVGALATLVATASAVSACSALLDTDHLDRNRCDAPSDCPSGETCELATHVCTGEGESDATTGDAGTEAGSAEAGGGGGGLPVSDWQYELSTATTVTLGGVALDSFGNVLVVGTGGSEVTGMNNGGTAGQDIHTTAYPEEFFSGLSGDGQNERFNDRAPADDDGGSPVPMALFAADLVDAGSPPVPTSAPLLVATLVPGDPLQLVLDAYRYDATGGTAGVRAQKIRETITLETVTPNGGIPMSDASLGGPRDAGALFVSTVSLSAALPAPSGALYIAGSFAGAITVDATTYTSLTDSDGVPSNDGFIMRFDPAGAPTETWVFATHDDDTVSSLCDVDGDLGIGGVFTDSTGTGAPLLFQGIPTGVVSAGKGDGFYAVMSESTGALRFAGGIGGAAQDAVRAVAYAPSSKQLLVGGRATMGFTIGDQQFDAGTDFEFALLSAFDAADGGAVWANLYPKGSSNGEGNADSVISHLTVLPGGDILVGGTFANELDIGDAALVPSPSTSRRGFLAHLAADGGARWSAVLGDSIHDILLDDGGILVTGSFTQPLTLAGGATFAPSGSNDAGAIFLAHFPSP